MNNTLEIARDAMFKDMDSAPAPVKVEYGTWADGYNARTQGLPCPPGASKEFKIGYGIHDDEAAGYRLAQLVNSCPSGVSRIFEEGFGRGFEEEAKAENGY